MYITALLLLESMGPGAGQLVDAVPVLRQHVTDNGRALPVVVRTLSVPNLGSIAQDVNEISNLVNVIPGIVDTAESTFDQLFNRTIQLRSSNVIKTPVLPTIISPTCRFEARWHLQE